MQESGRLAGLLERPDLVGARHLDDLDRDLLARFIREFEASLDDRHFDETDGRRLVSQLVDTFRFLQRRRPTQILVRTVWPDAAGEEGEATTVLEVAQREQPFVLDTVELALEVHGQRVIARQSTTIAMQRDASGNLTGVGGTAGHPFPEIIARFVLPGRLEGEPLALLEKDIARRLRVAQRVVRHFKRMKSRLRAVAKHYKRNLAAGVTGAFDAAVLAETRDFLDWLLDENFVFLGMHRYALSPGETPEPLAGQGCGYEELIEEDRRHAGILLDRMEREPRYRDACVISFKGTEESLVHREGKIDNFLVRDFDEEGNPSGYLHIRGLLTFKAIQTLGSEVPLVRRTLATLLAARRLAAESVRGRAYTDALNSIPLEFLFQAREAEIHAIVEAILYVERSKELASHVVVDNRNRKALYFLVLPRQSYSEEQRLRIESILLDELGANYSDSRVNLGKYDTVLLSFFLTAAESFHEFTREQLDERVRSVAGTWEERLARQLQRAEGRRARPLLARYQSAFPDEYRAVHAPVEALVDIAHLERVLDPTGPGISFEVVCTKEDLRKQRARLRLYLRRNVYLSMVLPVLDNFGLQVMEQAAFPVTTPEGSTLHIQTFHVAGVDREGHPLLARKAEFLEALDVVFGQHVGNDPLNRLVIEAGLGWQDVDLLRAYLHYLHQLGVSTTTVFAANTLRQHPAITRLLVEHHRLRFDPDSGDDLDSRSEKAVAIEKEIDTALAGVPSSAQDHFLRMLLNAMQATLRTTRYQQRSREQYLVAFKVDTRALTVGSEPRPWREIYVHHHELEGIHLRGGKLARGGIRWSDRVTDFREEVLGLQRTQMVKNVLIVPVGAKGGFVLRQPDPEPRARRAQADRLYRVFIGALLDLTDNVVDGTVVPPSRVVRYDGDDPYLVVAADKGTAHLSDAANEISLARGFWLGDAFASGGSNGYDHKELGITARGAWEGTQRHFRERGLDPATTDFTVVGIGDMSGDVFGNGLLLSRRMRLLAAFNHMSIFIDPDPDPERSFEERRRLFTLPGSTWEDYSPDVLSRGGQVLPRHAKTVRLTPEAQELLGITADEVDPARVIRAILTAKVDLLWNGGIGTYIRSSLEDDRDVGDLANASVRVEARHVKAKTISEGGNLGLTQRARVQFALRGGQINTDFIDNSGGVDTSDHEVNLKILLARPVAQGEISQEERNRILAEIEEEVCQEVLRNSSSQGRMLSLDEIRAKRDPFAFERTMKTLEDRGWIERSRESLPNLETIVNRQGQGIGLTRPELAVIGAYAKMHLYHSLQEDVATLERELEGDLRAYFPATIRDRFAGTIPEHLLAREIALTVLVNRIVGYAGAAFVSDAQRETGRSAAEIAHAYLVVDRIFESSELRSKVLRHDPPLPAEAEYRALLAIEEANRRAVSWVLADVAHRFPRLSECRREVAKQVREYRAGLAEALPTEERTRHEKFVAEFAAAGFSPEIARVLADRSYITAGLRIADIARECDAPIAPVTALYYRLGSSSYIHPLVRRFDENVFVGRWESLSLRIVRNSLLDSLWALVAGLIRDRGPVAGRAWVDDTVAEVKEWPLFRELSSDLRRLGREEITIAALHVLSVRLARLI